MSKYIYKNLSKQQIKVTKIVGYSIAVFFGIVYLFTRYKLGVIHPLLTITGVFVVAGFLNMLSYELHKNIRFTYQLIIFKSYIVVVALAYFTGGLNSPAIFILAVCTVAAFSTSKKQGTLWSIITFLTVFILLLSDNTLPKSIITPDIQLIFSFGSMFFVLSTCITISYLVNRSSFAVHRAFDRDSKELKDKTLRLENLTTLLNYSNDLMCIIDLNTFIIDDLNPVFKLHLGFELSQVRGIELMRFIKQDDSIEKLKSDIRFMKDDQVIEFSCILLCKDGSEKPFKWVGIAKNGKMYASARESK